MHMEPHPLGVGEGMKFICSGVVSGNVWATIKKLSKQLQNSGGGEIPASPPQLVGNPEWTLYHYDVMGVKVSTKWRKYRRTCKQARSYVFVQENYIKARLLVFSPFSAHFYPPLHHNGKGSIRKGKKGGKIVYPCVGQLDPRS